MDQPNQAEFIVSIRPGTLYIVATPIGNLEDISARALEVLGNVNLVAAEDTRHSGQMLAHFGITTNLVSCHDFNERAVVTDLIAQLQSGQDIAVISDAGTPLINDPGYRLVRAAHANHIRVIPIPGPSALICALSAAGLPTDRFVFEGYPPERQAARLRYLQTLAAETRTIVFYETPHRIAEFIDDAQSVFGGERPAAIAREMTKKFESIDTGTLAELSTSLASGIIPARGEFVIVIQGAHAQAGDEQVMQAEKLLGVLLEELPLKKAAALTAKITGLPKNRLYELGLKQQGS